ncbi:hypothetical protein Q4603_17425 [Zobellia galactanivorans]|uniref:hypothetical protein n=1 Tax=Zobellia galactanivorans (strain DSM 12802 / CCUG 47099 / CIP 106680 / NCIMB 13871 / Dsij) TaxID=63186 RepID=UPI0026E29AFA|nr:hypothetical protein [Zobellia galactanivorans]MDO6810407.1 hypothetical protein [Zobellia galactanivorans]
MRYFKFLFLLCVVSVSAQNYNYALDEKSVPDSQHSEVDSGPVRIIPLAFDWQNIPEDYSDSVWEIRYDFDLAGQTVILPENVTIRFNGGVLANGTVRGDESVIETKTEDQIFDALDLEGSFTTDYLKPQWFGAAMDGASDDREEFVETLAQAERIGAKVLVDRDMFLDLEETGKKSIFLEDNTWIEGANDANIIINNLLSPAFYMALTKNITIKNVTFLYDQKYDATFGWDDKMHEVNLDQLESYLSHTKNIVFVSSNPVARSPIAWRAIISLQAAEGVNIDNVKFKAKGETADTFIQWAIKFGEQYNPNQRITENNEKDTDVSRNVSLSNVVLDGVLMGVQGIVDGFYCNGLKGYRYSDVQDKFGKNIGGSGVGGKYWMPPPHLFYLNPDKSHNYISRNIEILNTTDYGIYVGSENTRGGNGYTHSLKLVEGVENVKIENYKSYRRDGLWDFGNINNGTFSNIYCESTSEIFDPNWKFVAARFLEPLNNCFFDNIVIKDLSEKSKIYPLDVAEGNFVTMEDIHVYVNELSTEGHGPFGISGSNNTVINSSLNIKRHTTKKTYRGVVYQDDQTKDFSGSDNFYDISVVGWRKVSSDIEGLCPRLIFHGKANPNTNFARVTDVSNNLVIEQQNGEKKISEFEN